MSRQPGWLAAVLASLMLSSIYSCRSSTLRPPTEDEVRLINSAVQGYIESRSGGAATLPVFDVDRGAERNVRVGELGHPITLRRRSFRVSATGVDEDGTILNVAFFVLQTGPVFIVDTAVSSDRESGFAP